MIEDCESYRNDTDKLRDFLDNIELICKFKTGEDIVLEIPCESEYRDYYIICIVTRNIIPILLHVS